jgi:hypothetical protein
VLRRGAQSEVLPPGHRAQPSAFTGDLEEDRQQATVVCRTQNIDPGESSGVEDLSNFLSAKEMRPVRLV